MRFLRKITDKQSRHFKEGGRFQSLWYLFEGIESFLFSTNKQTSGLVHSRDVIDLKRTMITVFWALVPAALFGMYNIGYQAHLVPAVAGDAAALTWQQQAVQGMGLTLTASSHLANFLVGLLHFLPVYLVTLAVGGFWEVVFAVTRKHQISEGFLVTSLLFPLILPPTIPLWQAALGISFGVVLGKEVFGGVGMNIWNPALTARVFLFFAYPAQISGDTVWTAVDSVSRATPLAELADPALTVSVDWMEAFLGFIPGSMGETSTLACLMGAAVLILTGIGSWRIMLSVGAGMAVTALALNGMGSAANPLFQVGPHMHLVLGGFAFGTVFMATDPVSAAITKPGKIVYGVLIGFLVVMIRVVNPAFPEGMMLAILFGNTFAPIIDRVFINRTIRRRLARNEA